MKKLFFTLILIIGVITVRAVDFTSLNTGDWEDGTTWNQSGAVPALGDNVTIADGHIVTINTNTTQNCKELTINTGAELVLPSGYSANLTTAQHVNVNGILTVQSGVLNAGDAVSDWFYVSGGTFNFSGGVVNVAGRYSQSSGGDAYFSESAIINISTAGNQTGTSRSFSVTTSGEFSVANGSTVQIVIKHGNTGSTTELYYSPTISNFNGGSIIVENNTGISDIYLDSDEAINEIESKVGAGNNFHFVSGCDFSLMDLIITSGEVHVDVGAQVDITGTATLNDALVVKSNSTGNGSVIPFGTVTGTADVERYFAAYTVADDGWHIIGSPVHNMTISGSDFDPTGTNNDLYAWDEDDYIWRNYKGSNFPGTTFANGNGYMVAYESEVTNIYSGNLNITDVTLVNLSLTPTQGDGWHLLGNPFTSAMKWNDGNWTLTNVAGVAKVYNEFTGNYIDINSNGVIPSTNGFFVQVSSSTNEIIIPAASRSHSDINNYKNYSYGEMDETLIFIINNDDNSFSDKASVGFREDAETAFDWAFDSHKMFGQSKAPQLWTVIEGEEYSTNNLPFVYESYVLPLYFKAGVNTTYHILSEGIESFYLNSDIYLEDRFTGNIIDLRDQSMYTFNGSIADDSYRFDIHFFGVTKSVGNEDKQEAVIYGVDKTIYIKTEFPHRNMEIEVYNILGCSVLSEKFSSSGLDSFEPHVNTGVYIVVLKAGNTIITRKITLQ